MLMGRVAAKVRNAISIAPEETSDLLRLLWICFAVMSVSLLSGCAQHNQDGNHLQVIPSEAVRNPQAVAQHQDAIVAEPYILSLAEEQDIESVRLSHCQSHRFCK